MKLSRNVLALVSIGMLGWSAALYACLDTNAIDFTPKASPLAPPVDASADAGDADFRRPCQVCTESPDDAGGGCGTEVAACVNDPVCSQIYACALGHLCFEKTSQRDTLVCGVPCAEEAGVTSTVDPAITMILGITGCLFSGPCAAICGADAGAR